MFICQICKKAPATIHLTDIHNNVKKEVHICEACAAEKGFNLQGTANLPQLLGLAAKKGVPAPKHPHHHSTQIKAKVTEEDLICLKCGTTWSQFSERGRLGCPNDYQVFGERLRNLIANQIAPHTRDCEKIHVGKRPGPRRAVDERAQAVRLMEKKLRQAVAEENYETAARLKAELDAMRARQQEGERS